MIYRCISFAAVLLAAALGSQPVLAAPQCEYDRPIMFANLDWDSNRVHTEIVSYIFEKGYGCETDSLPGSTIPLLTGMIRGDIDVTMEIWGENVADAWKKGESEGKVTLISVNFPDAVQGFYVPTYLVKGDAKRGIKAQAPDLKSVDDLPKYKMLFKDPEEPDKGRFYNCILGWGCEKINTKKYKIYGMDKHFTNFRPGTGAALSAAIASNYERGKPFVAYYWGPTWILGKYDMTMLEEPPYDKKIWEELEANDNPAKATAYPIVSVWIGTTTVFKAKAPMLVEFLTKYETSNKMVSDVLAYMREKKGATAKDAALHFLKTRADVWTKWVPEDVAKSVKGSLGAS